MSPKSTELERQPAATAQAEPVSRATEMTDAWFSAARGGQETSLQAARQFVELVDVVLPVQGGDESKRRRLIDGAFTFVDSAASAQLSMARRALHGAVLVYVNFDIKAFNGVDVGVDVTVPTDVGMFKTREEGLH